MDQMDTAAPHAAAGERGAMQEAQRTGIVAPRAAIGAAAVGALALGATAIGALAIGRLAIGALALRRGRVRALTIDDLEVGRLHVREVIIDHRSPVVD